MVSDTCLFAVMLCIPQNVTSAIVSHSVGTFLDLAQYGIYSVIFKIFKTVAVTFCVWKVQCMYGWRAHSGGAG